MTIGKELIDWNFWCHESQPLVWILQFKIMFSRKTIEQQENWFAYNINFNIFTSGSRCEYEKKILLEWSQREHQTGDSTKFFCVLWKIFGLNQTIFIWSLQNFNPNFHNFAFSQKNLSFVISGIWYNELAEIMFNCHFK